MSQSNLTMANPTQWYQVEITDPLCLPGTSILKAIELINENKQFKFVIINDLIGAIPQSLFAKEDKILELDELLNELPNVVQFDWGNFYMFKDQPSEWNTEYYPNLSDIGKADVTLRAVDDGYIYVYTHSTTMVDVLKKTYPDVVVKMDLLANLDYPV